MSVSAVHGVLVGEVPVDHVVSVTGETHVFSAEFSLSAFEAAIVFPGGEEAHAHVGFLGCFGTLVFLGLVGLLGSAAFVFDAVGSFGSHGLFTGISVLDTLTVR